MKKIIFSFSIAPVSCKMFLSFRRRSLSFFIYLVVVYYFFIVCSVSFYYVSIYPRRSPRKRVFVFLEHFLQSVVFDRSPLKIGPFFTKRGGRGYDPRGLHCSNRDGVCHFIINLSKCFHLFSSIDER